MSDVSTAISRRTVLRSAAGAVPAVGGAGLATAGDGRDGVAKYNVGYSAESGAAAAREAASEVVREYNFDALTVRLPERAVSGLRSRPDVRYVEENATASTAGETLPWGVDRIDADEVHQVEQGTGVDVAVLDTGIDGDHADLAGNLGLGAWVDEGCDTCDYGWGDDEGHGTAVAGIVGAIEDFSDVVGVAPEVTLHSVQVCDTADSCEWDEIAAGLEWTADQGYEVANMSLSGPYSDVVSDAVAYAADRGVLMVAAAGNDGPCTDCVGHPATEPAVVAVSAIDRTESLEQDSSQGPEIDLAAPGLDVETTLLGGGTTLFSKTSAATPHVAGAAAYARVVADSRAEAKSLLVNKGEDVGLSAEEQGHGLVDAGAIYNDPWVVTDGVSPGKTSATLYGDLEYLGLNESVDVYFEWGLQGGSLANATPSQTLGSPGTYSQTVTVSCETNYAYRAVAEGTDGSTYRSYALGFTTGPCDGDCTSSTISTDKVCTQSSSS